SLLLSSCPPTTRAGKNKFSTQRTQRIQSCASTLRLRRIVRNNNRQYKTFQCAPKSCFGDCCFSRRWPLAANEVDAESTEKCISAPVFLCVFCLLCVEALGFHPRL